MVPILGKPVMEYLIEHLARYGITEIMVNVAYHHRKIEEYFGDGRRWGSISDIRSRVFTIMAISCPSPRARPAE
jgi:NDP-sugar pyrophosphorylase family protein